MKHFSTAGWTLVAILFAVFATLSSTRTQLAAQTTQPQGGEQMDAAKLQLLLDYTEIVNAVNAVGITADRKDWQGCRTLFTDEVDIDYTSIAGGTPSSVKADALIESWRKALGGFKATQHAISNHRITINGDEADSFSYVHAMHYLPHDKGSNHWIVYGYYDHMLVRTPGGWKVKAMKFTVTYAEGNQQLFQLAAAAMEKK
jgi:hypothetical protein